MLSIGQVVYCKAGRDKGHPFFITGIEGEYVFICDGKRRSVIRPKKKKIKHIQPTKTVDENIRERLEGNLYLKDSDLRTALAKLTGSII